MYMLGFITKDNTFVWTHLEIRQGEMKKMDLRRACIAWRLMFKRCVEVFLEILLYLSFN